MKLRKRMIMIITIIILMVSLTGCGSKPPQTGTGSEGGAVKELTLAYPNDIGTLNPHKYDSQMFAQYFVYENLVNYGENGVIEPCLATSWDISEDGKVYTFALRKDVKFSDGTPFDAHIVKKNYDAILSVQDRHSWLELVKQIDKTEVVDEYTFRIYLKNSYYPVLQELTLVRPMRILGEAGFPESGKTDEEIKSPIGTGPWMLETYKKDEYAVFVQNPNYWGEKPKITKLTVKIIPDSDTAASALEAGEVDLIHGSGILNIDTFKSLEGMDGFNTLMSEPYTTTVLAVNSNHGLTKEKAVREALQYLVDKDSIVDHILSGVEQTAYTLFSENTPYCNIGLEKRAYDSKKAEELLESAGWELNTKTGLREKEGLVLALDLYFPATDAKLKSISQAIQGDAKKVGMLINLYGDEANVSTERQKKGNFDLMFGESWGQPYDPHSCVSSFREPSHFDYQAQSGLTQKSEIDRKITEVLISTDEKLRQTLYTEILTTLHEECVYLPISYKREMAIFNKNVTGVTFGNAGEIPTITLDRISK